MARRPPELDLHGHTVDSALARFTALYNETRLAGQHSRLVVIHGWNASAWQGSIADMLHRLLKRRGVTFEHPYQGNIGRTAVRIGAAMPGAAARSTPALKRSAKGAPRKLSGGL